MNFESRKSVGKKSSPLPLDYLKMVDELLKTHFDEPLKTLGHRPKLKDARLTARGAVYPGELLLVISLESKASLHATSVYASTDFDPKASSPKIQDLLGACLDAAGQILDSLLDLKKDNRTENLEEPSVAALSDDSSLPLEWAHLEVERFKVFVKIDKANPSLEASADEWLRQNDPQAAAEVEEEQKETEELFFTGPREKTKH